MIIHVVEKGETLQSIARKYQVSVQRLQEYNEIENPEHLVVGQTIVVLIPEIVHTVAQGESLYEIAESYDVEVIELYQNNPELIMQATLYPGEEIVIKFQGDKIGTMSINGYAYPYIDRTVLKKTLPYLTYITLFTYGFTPEGELITIEDQEIIDTAKEYGVTPIMLLSTYTTEGTFSNALASQMLNNEEVQENLIRNIIDNLNEKGYGGLDLDFEYILPEDREAYIAFIENVTKQLNSLGYFVVTALAPKTSADQKGLLYEAHDYKGIGAVSNYVLLMTYEWGYSQGPPMAVAPINKVKEVLNYAVTEIEPYKIFMGIPNYGYDWPLPFEQGVTKARSLGNVEAVNRAAQNNAQIEFDEISQAPYYFYTTDEGNEHVVWFEDARSIDAKVRLIPLYDLNGASYWNIMKFFPQNWLVVNALFDIRKVLDE